MNEARINASGADGSGSAVNIYETPDYCYPSHGSRVAHGVFCIGVSSPDTQRVEVVDLFLPFDLSFRVRADDVRDELRALLDATVEKSDADERRAFDSLSVAIFRITAPHLRVEHFELMASSAFKHGEQEGMRSPRNAFRNLLDL